MSKTDFINKSYFERYFITRNKILEKWPKSMLLMQCGTFYEIYGYNEPTDPVFQYYYIMDCRAPWKKCSHNDKDVMCCGYPVESLDKTVKRLTQEGWYVEVHDEVGKNKKKQKIHEHKNSFSPGTFTPLNNNELTKNCCCIFIEKKYNHSKLSPSINIAISSINLLSGNSKLYQYMHTSQFIMSSDTFEQLDRFLSINTPKEIWLFHNLKKVDDIFTFINVDSIRINKYRTDEIHNYSTLIKKCKNKDIQKEILFEFFKPNDPDFWIENLGFNDNYYASISYCLLLKTIIYYNPGLTNKLSYPIIETLNNKLVLKTHSLKQLNIIDTHHNSGQFSSVEKLINKCKTSMGKREFKNMLVSPTVDINILKQDYNAIEHVLKKDSYINSIRDILMNISDIEKLYRKFVMNKSVPMDISKLWQSFQCIKHINKIIHSDKKLKSYIIFKNEKLCSHDLENLINLLEKKFNIEVCAKVSKIDPEEIIFNRDVYSDLDNEQDKWNEVNEKLNTYKCTMEHIIGKENTVELHKTEKSGVFFRATSARAKKIMDNKDNSPESNGVWLTDLKLSSAGDSKKKLVCHELTTLYDSYSQCYSNLFELQTCKFKQFIKNELLELNKEIRNIVNFVTLIDITINKAFISKKYNYCKPVIQNKIKKAFVNACELRHPLVEHIQTNEIYTTNDIALGKKTDGMLLYGTNTSGKSTLIKSIGISVVMAQAGMYVPATKFQFKPYNTLYTRILGNDNLFKSLSTFATEMSEFSSIYNHADHNSLVLGDELCSGTEHPSAIGIICSGLEKFCSDKVSFIFATHCHELDTIKELKKFKNLTWKHLHFTYNEYEGLVYNRKLRDGKGPDHYGIEICKNFNFLPKFQERANYFREQYLNKNSLKIKQTKYSSKKIKGCCELCGKKGVDVHHLNPQEYANENGFIGSHHKNHKANLANVCKDCHIEVTKNKIIHKRIKTPDGYKLVEISREK
jgi:DNA mismatch repair protein MutS